jgi:NAD-dependent deacetylase
LHGSTLRNFCTECHKFFDVDYVASHADKNGIPRCDKCNGLIKPDVVLYGESLNQNTIEGAVTALKEADMLIIGGTSLVVYPAAGLIQYYRGHKLAVINKGGAGSGLGAAVTIDGPIGQVMAQL